MHEDTLDNWAHGHSFGQDVKRPGERRTFIVVAITATMMVVEIVAGLAFASMALTADGLHMASHAVALTVAAAAYVYARRHAHDPRFSFGTGKVNALGGFTGAVLLAAFALLMAAGSVERLVHPATIALDYAILVAVLGLIVNGVCVVILNAGGNHGTHGHGAHEQGGRDGHKDDHTLRAAYLHVLADALTSVLAIVALLAAKYGGLMWMDPVMGIVGASLVARWSLGLLRTTSAVLLDKGGPSDVGDSITQSLQADGDSRVAGLHLWAIGPGIYAAEITIVAHEPFSPADYKARIPHDLGVAHVSIEIHECRRFADQPHSMDPVGAAAEGRAPSARPAIRGRRDAGGAA